MKSETPTSRDISPTEGLDLDEKKAIDHFLGKGISDAEALFREHSIYYSNDLLWMGPVAFRFYLPAFTGYLKSPEAAGDSAGLHSLIILIEAKMPDDAASLVSVKDELLLCLDHCIANYSKFEVNADVYGDLKGKLVEIKAKAGACKRGRREGQDRR